MHKHFQTLLAVLPLLCGLGWLASSAAASPLGGVNIIGPDYGVQLERADQAVARAHALHAKVVRTEVPWSVLQPLGPNEVDPQPLAFTDRVVADAVAAGMKIVMLVDSTPCWASSAPPSIRGECVPRQPNEASSWPPSDPGTYAAFTALLAKRYGPQVTAIEVWNEPDQANEAYFAGPHKAERYAALLRAAYPAVKRVSPQTSVLGGSIVGSNGRFLQALYAAGIKGYYDGLAVHFYTLTLAGLRTTHAVQLANGDHTPLWLDEFGWSSCWPRSRVQQEQACVTPDTQARNFTNLFRSLKRAPYVAAATFFKLEDSFGENFGAFDTAGRRKPSFSALSRVLVSSLGRPSGVTLRLGSSGGRVLASGAGPVGDFMELEAFQRGALRFRATFALDRFNRYSLLLPRALGSRGLHVRVFQLWSGAGSAAHKSI